MTVAPVQFPYVQRTLASRSVSLVPMLPLVLNGSKSVHTHGLLDTGAALNVLPYSVGLSLGLDWDSQCSSVQLSGNIASVEARVVVVSAEIGPFSPVRLAFAWAKTDEVLVLLGQVNFFMEFDVCFFRARTVFEVRPKP